MPKDPGAAETRIEEAERLIDDLRKELTILIEELRPAALEDKGLASAVRAYAEDWSRQNGQEALANVARHSQASSVEIGLVYTKLEITCTINDDGIGFDPEKKSDGFGIRSMQERAEALGSTVTLVSAPGKGTRISFTVDFEKPSKNEKKVIHE